ncbi:MAG: PBP1A family penicillin-binding protein [Rhizobiales bacterium]|nr:PBP1A family penicillin-binding protein [Hyphomicrobiales bacterium]
MSLKLKILSIAAAVFLVAILGAGLAGGLYLWHLNQDLPDASKLANYEPPVMTRVHAGDGKIIAEYATERRLYVPIDVIPKPVIQAFLAAEDKNFYSHGGVDAVGIMRAVFDNIVNVFRDRRMVGASTITQQVAKNFLLSNDRTFERKLREVLVSMRLEQAYTKDKILELYLNEIYLGVGSYGVAAAALNYFGKPLDELTIAQAAYLATLPKAPNNYHPFRFHDRAVARRNWVIGRMAEDGFITEEQAAEAQQTDLDVTLRPVGVQIADAQYFVEQVRRELYNQYGEKKLYEGGLSVRTTIDTKLQAIATSAMRKGLIEYDRRQGWRGATSKLEPGVTWTDALKNMAFPGDLTPWTLAVVLKVDANSATIGLRPEEMEDGQFSKEVRKGTIPLSEVKWARPSLPKGYLGPEVKSVGDVLSVGDVIYAEPVFKEKSKTAIDHYALMQVPLVNGSVIAMDPHTGRVLAMQGGFSYSLSEFNRATQALRQPGSAFKPFVYAAALDSGFTPSSLVLDAPFVSEQGPGLALWKPENYEHDFHGPSTLRYGLEHSRNVMTVRLAQAVGMDKVALYAKRFGIMDNMMPVLSMSLGAGETTLMKLAAAYAILDNGGKEVKPTLIDRIQDRWGRTIYRHDDRPCNGCNDPWEGQSPPELPDDREQIENPQTAYQVTSLLEGVIQRGTGSAARRVGVPLAGKTGTSSEARDAWFMGYSPNLVIGVFVGYDEPTPLGRAETGGRTAAPIFADIMQQAIGDKPAIPFRVPSGISLVRVDAATGQPAGPGTQKVILEAFKTGTELQASASSQRTLGVVGGSSVSTDAGFGSDDTAGDGLTTGTGGLY